MGEGGLLGRAHCTCACKEVNTIVNTVGSGSEVREAGDRVLVGEGGLLGGPTVYTCAKKPNPRIDAGTG